jgi:hypothetical protein
MEENELLFEIIIKRGEDDELSFTIDEEEVNYILQQIKFNQPFIIVVEDSFFSFSPYQCPSIEIKPLK